MYYNSKKDGFVGSVTDPWVLRYCGSMLEGILGLLGIAIIVLSIVVAAGRPDPCLADLERDTMDV